MRNPYVCIGAIVTTQDKEGQVISVTKDVVVIKSQHSYSAIPKKSITAVVSYKEVD